MEKNIYQRINAIMSECEYIQKKQAQAGKGVLYDEVIAMLRPLMIKHGVVMRVHQNEFSHISTVKNKDGSESNQKTYQGSYSLDLINMDNPEEVVTNTAFSHGMDGGDKAPGKAQTYAVKIMLTKAFCIETGIDEESRAEKEEASEGYTRQWVESFSECEDLESLAATWRNCYNSVKNSKKTLKLLTSEKDKRKSELEGDL